jgi:hypothetical protein
MPRIRINPTKFGQSKTKPEPEPEIVPEPDTVPEPKTVTEFEPETVPELETTELVQDVDEVDTDTDTDTDTEGENCRVPINEDEFISRMFQMGPNCMMFQQPMSMPSAENDINKLLVTGDKNVAEVLDDIRVSLDCLVKAVLKINQTLVKHFDQPK